MLDIIKKEFENHIKTLEIVQSSMEKDIKTVGELILEQFKNNKKILIFGNGGSAADAQHFSAELVNRYKTNRKALPAIALTTDSSILTSIANDFNYDTVFSRQIEALSNNGDIVFAISTSGNSTSIIKALKVAKENNCKIVGLSGNNGGSMDQYCDINMIVPSDNTPRIQEVHILVIHMLCEIIDTKLKDK